MILLPTAADLAEMGITGPKQRRFFEAVQNIGAESEISPTERKHILKNDLQKVSQAYNTEFEPGTTVIEYAGSLDSYDLLLDGSNDGSVFNCEKLYVVYDPRSEPRNIQRDTAGFTGSDLTLFVLLPSTNSGKESLLMAEVALQQLGPVVVGCPTDDIRVVRMDEWLTYGHPILKAMIDSQASVYPADEVC